MQVKNVSIQEMYEALKVLNESYNGNIQFKRIEYRGTRIIFTLKVKDNKGLGTSINLSYYLNEVNGKSNKGHPKHSGSASWYAHGYFFEKLLAINQNAEITSMLGIINKDGGNWQDKTLGSPYYGYVEMSELSDNEPTSEKLKTVEVRSIKQSDLSGECWSVQFHGLSACDECEYLNTSDCGGKNIRKTLMNEKGIKVPL